MNAPHPAPSNASARHALQPHYLPETDPAQIQSFRVDETLGIRGVLRELMTRRAMVTIYAPDNFDAFIPSRVLAFDERALDLDFVADEERRREILSHPSAVVIGTLDRIKVQFEVSGFAPTTLQDNPALHCPVPKAVYRIQRRDAFRVRPLATEPVTCHVRDGRGGESAWKVLDFSALGVAFSVPPDQTPPAEKSVLQHCRLEFAPSRAAIPINLVVRRVSTTPEDGSQGYRVGCEFRYLAPEAARTLQMAVMEIERRGRAN
jgi:c-di-GMP-binding flagellar brake protein YcgR